MTDKLSAGLGVVVALIITVPMMARSDVRRETTERRPYIVEIGQPSEITMRAVHREARNISELTEYLADYGYPDYAETQEIAPQWPWEAYEVRLYYLARDIEVDFGHVILSPAAAHLGMRKFTGPIPPDKRHEIEVVLQARQAPLAAPVVAGAPPPPPPPAAPVAAEQPSTGGLTEALVARIEAAAERAAQAADHAAEQSEAAVRAADRTVTIVEKMAETAAPQGRGRR